MNNPPRLDSRIFLSSAFLGALTALALPACGTEQFGGAQTVVSNTPTDPSQGALLVVLASTAETYDEVLANSRANKNDTAYHVLIDGKELMIDDTYSVQPLVVGRGGAFGAGFHDGGTHHFALAALDGSPDFEIDGMIASGANNRFYFFGPPDALQARFVSTPFEPPAGQVHISAINLVRSGGVQIEIVSCTDAATCAPVSPRLALGDTFNADLPLIATSASGAGYGYRQVATAALPAPPIIWLWSADWLTGVPADLRAAPVYMASDGSFLSGVP